MAKKKPVKKLTEAEKKKLADKKLLEAAEKEKEKAESESEAEKESGADDADDADADHPDADKDVELIKKMIAQHLGDSTKDMSAEEMESLHALGHEAYQAHKEMGASEKEAFDHAGNALKLAQHMSKKSKGVEEAEGEDDAEKVPPKKKKPAAADDDAGADDEADDDESEESVGEAEKESESESENKESSKREQELEKKLLEAEGRIAAFEATTKKTEISRYVDLKLKESKHPASVTKKFREAAGDIKTKEDFDAKWKVFLSGVQDRSPLDFSILMEKSTGTEDGGKAKDGKGLDFSDCAE